MIEFYGFNIDHFLGQGWNKDNHDDSLIFQKYSNSKSNTIRNRLIDIRG